MRKMFQVDPETGDAPKEPKSGNDNKASETKSNLQPKGRIESKLRCGGGSIALKHERESYERCPGSAEVTFNRSSDNKTVARLVPRMDFTSKDVKTWSRALEMER